MGPTLPGGRARGRWKRQHSPTGTRRAGSLAAAPASPHPPGTGCLQGLPRSAQPWEGPSRCPSWRCWCSRGEQRASSQGQGNQQVLPALEGEGLLVTVGWGGLRVKEQTGLPRSLWGFDLPHSWTVAGSRGDRCTWPAAQSPPLASTRPGPPASITLCRSRGQPPTAREVVSRSAAGLVLDVHCVDDAQEGSRREGGDSGRPSARAWGLSRVLGPSQARGLDVCCPQGLHAGATEGPGQAPQALTPPGAVPCGHCLPSRKWARGEPATSPTLHQLGSPAPRFPS